jgi:hypothetical protein
VAVVVAVVYYSLEAQEVLVAVVMVEMEELTAALKADLMLLSTLAVVVAVVDTTRLLIRSTLEAQAVRAL